MRLEALLFATEAAQRELSRQLALNLPIAGQLVNDPELPMHLRRIAGVVLNVVRDVAARLDQSLDPAEDI